MEDNNIQDSCCNSKYVSIRQMDKLDEMLGRRFPFYPRTVIQAVHDGRTGAPLEAILAQYNNIYVQFQGTAVRTRNIVPKEMRRKGIIISYVDMLGNAITEKCVNDAQRDNFHWGLDVNWVRVDELTLSGDISVSVKGTWVINGEDTGIAALGPKGDNGLTPWLKTIDNKLHFSYDNETWKECSDYVAAYFRFQDNKFQISRDKKKWSNLSGEFADGIYIQGYVATQSKLPVNAPQGSIYMVGPTYASDDTEHINPTYRMYVKNASGWVDNGFFQSISAGIVQELGDSETEVVSQKTATLNFRRATPFINGAETMYIRELYINLDGLDEFKGFSKYGMRFFGWDSDNSRFVFSIVGTNDDYATYTPITYYENKLDTDINGKMIQLTKYQNSGITVGYVIFDNISASIKLKSKIDLTEGIFNLNNSSNIYSLYNTDNVKRLVNGTPVIFIYGGYIPTNGNVIDLDNIIISNAHAYKVVDCKEGDTFLISGLGGTSPRLYCFIDTFNKPLLVAGINLSCNKKIIVAPPNSVKMVVNVITTSSTSIPGYIEPELNYYSAVMEAFRINYNNIQAGNKIYSENIEANSRLAELYIREKLFNKYRILYMFYQTSENRYVFQLQGSNDDFDTFYNLVYYTTPELPVNEIIPMPYFSTGVGVCCYVIFHNFDKNSTSYARGNVMDISFDLEYSPTIKSYLSSYKLLTSQNSKALNFPNKLIGALFFDGWGGKSHYTLGNESLFPNSTLPGKEEYTDWREYAKEHDFELISKNAYPPNDCSFSMFYPKQAIEKYPSRKPYLGWVITTKEQMENQIDLAINYGIDYFMFCFYLPSNVAEAVDQEGNLVTSVIEENSYNNAIYKFMEASNSYKMKFSVMLCDHGNRMTSKILYQFMDYINSRFVSHNSYLFMNGRPVIALFDTSFTSKVHNNHHIGGSVLLLNTFNPVYGGINGRMSYAGAIPSDVGLLDYGRLSSFNIGKISSTYGISPSLLDIPTVAVGRNEYPRADFVTKNESNSVAFKEPSKEELFDSIKGVIELLPNFSSGDQTVLLYAWNEIGEGGFLLPSRGITTTVANEFPLLNDDGEQEKDDDGNLLYYSLYKLEAVKEAKDYWESV